MNPSKSSIGATKVADLTIEQFKELVRKVVLQTLSDTIGDSDEGQESRDDFVQEAKQTVTYEEIGRKGVLIEEVAEKLGILQLSLENATPLPEDQFEALAEALADKFMEYIGPDYPSLTSYAVSRKGLYEDHL